MKPTRRLFLGSLTVGVVAAKKKKIPWMLGKVLTECRCPDTTGYYINVFGQGDMMVRNFHTRYLVTIETKFRTYYLAQADGLISPLPLYGFIDFYIDGDWFIVRNEGGQLHRFASWHIEEKALHEFTKTPADSSAPCPSPGASPDPPAKPPATTQPTEPPKREKVSL